VGLLNVLLLYDLLYFSKKKNNITGVVSACANPVLYGLLNENFKTEYKNLLVAWREKLLEIKL